MVLYAILLFKSIGYYCNENSELTILNIYCMLCCYFIQIYWNTVFRILLLLICSSGDIA